MSPHCLLGVAIRCDPDALDASWMMYISASEVTPIPLSVRVQVRVRDKDPSPLFQCEC